MSRARYHGFPAAAGRTALRKQQKFACQTGGGQTLVVALLLPLSLWFFERIFKYLSFFPHALTYLSSLYS